MNAFSETGRMNTRDYLRSQHVAIDPDDCVFIQADYPGLELRTLAQCCLDLFGQSELANTINRGEDPHLKFAAQLLKIPYEDAKKNKKSERVDAARQIGKVNNFGRPGGLGDEKLCLFARKTYGVTITIPEARQFKQIWFEAYPEMRLFFDHVGQLADTPSKKATVRQLRSNRIRGGAFYTAACNTFFQGLGADATNEAGFLIAEACYVDRASPLYGSRIVNFVHDEFIGESRVDRSHEAAHELARLMMVGANRWLPDVPFREGEIEPLTMNVWSKDAFPIVHPTSKRLVPWNPVLGGMIRLGETLQKRAA